MKQPILAALLAVAATILLSYAAPLAHARGALVPASTEHGWSVKEYELFHDILHPLEHEALPQGDFKRIRAEARELATRGQAIVNLGVPDGVDEKYLADFRAELKRFNEALTRFSRDATSGTDEQLKESYTAVHDSFEMLAAMLPRKKQASNR